MSVNSIFASFMISVIHYCKVLCTTSSGRTREQLGIHYLGRGVGGDREGTPDPRDDLLSAQTDASDRLALSTLLERSITVSVRLSL